VKNRSVLLDFSPPDFQIFCQ